MGAPWPAVWSGLLDGDVAEPTVAVGQVLTPLTHRTPCPGGGHSLGPFPLSLGAVCPGPACAGGGGGRLSPSQACGELPATPREEAGPASPSRTTPTLLGQAQRRPVSTLICLFIVIQKSMMKYMTRIGQNTGTLNASKKVQTMATRMPLVAACLKEGGEVSVLLLSSLALRALRGVWTAWHRSAERPPRVTQSQSGGGR